MSVMAANSIEHGVLESRTICRDFGPDLASGETLTGTPTVTAENQGLVNGSSELTLATKAINSAGVFTDPADGRVVATSEGVTAVISGGTAGEQYRLTFTASTSAGRTLSLQALVRAW